MVEVNRKTIILGLGLVFLAALPGVAAALDEPFLVSLFSRVLIYALAAVSLDLILGYGGMVSFGHAAFFGVGAYVVGILAIHAFEGTSVDLGFVQFPGTRQFLIVAPLAVIVSALVALAIGALSLRTTGIYFIMITLAFAQMIYFLFVSMERYGGDDGMFLWGRSTIPAIELGDRTTFYYVCLVCLVAFVVLASRLVQSRVGMVLQASRQNDRRARSLGLPTYRYRLAAFSISGAGSGLAGALVANHTEFVSPSLMVWTKSGELLIMVILGGMGTLFGPILGAAAFLLLEETASIYTEHWQIILGPVLLFVVLFARRGLYGWIIGHGDRAS